MAGRETVEYTGPGAPEAVEASKIVSLLAAEFLTPAQVAGLLKTSRRELADWRLERRGPPFMLRRRGVVVYPSDAFARYLRTRAQRNCREGTGPREVRRATAQNLKPRAIARGGDA
jgi:hypothetical protein